MDRLRLWRAIPILQAREDLRAALRILSPFTEAGSNYLMNLVKQAELVPEDKLGEWGIF